MANLFGGVLTIKDGFSNTFNKYTDSIKKGGESFNQFTKKIDKTSSTSDKVSKGMSNKWGQLFSKIKKDASSAFASINKNMNNFSKSMLGTISKLTAGFISLKTIISGFHNGFETGMEYQNLRVMLNSLYGDEKLAEQKFLMGSNYAQKTMFSENDVIKALSTMKGVGISDDEKTLSMMGDLGSFVSARTNGAMGINEAVEAYADMVQNGEWERMQTILNIKRTNLEAYGKEKGFKAFTNNQGQIIDRKTLEEVFKSYVDTKGITGLTEVMGKTATGQLQQTIGNLKKSLADLVGISNTGEVRDGSLFQKFIRGLQKLNNKITAFSNSPKFEKFSDALSKIGNAIYKAFSFILENPEVIVNLLKFGVALWALSKVSTIVTTISSIGSAFAGLLSVLAPLAPYILATVLTFMIAKSLFSEDGILNRGISSFLGKIPLVGTYLQEGFDNWTRLVREFFSDIADWIKEKLGFAKTEEPETDTYEDTEYNRKWYPEHFGGTVKYHTVADMEKTGAIVKADTSQINNNNNINFNVDTVRETADIDELMNRAMKQVDKYNSTRNPLI